MIDDYIRNKFDPDVYEFYKSALDGPGFSFPFTAKDIEFLRKDEVERHARNTNTYPCTSFDITIDRADAEALPVRVYKPNSESGTSGPKPVLLYFHGGGFIMGSIYDHDPLCGKLADACDAVVISVEYRLAPEYRFPACVDDAIVAANWAHEHSADFGGDPNRIMAGGDSSGANISTVLALLAKDGGKNYHDIYGEGLPAAVSYDENGDEISSGEPIRDIPEIQNLILFYGVFGCYGMDESDSAKRYGTGGYVLPNDMMDACMEMYLPDGISLEMLAGDKDIVDMRLTPGKGDLSDMPPAVIVTAEFDPLMDDGEEFAARYEAAGNKMHLIRMNGMMHGFILYWQHFKRAEQLIYEIGDMV